MSGTNKLTAAASSVLKQMMMKRFPSTASSAGRRGFLTHSSSGGGGGGKCYCNTNDIKVMTSFYSNNNNKRFFSSAAIDMDDEEEELERQILYGDNDGNSPITEYFNLAVHHGHTGIGPPSKYQPSESVVLKCGISEDDLSFKTSSYGRLIHTPHVQHQEHKVTLSVRWHVLPLNEFEKQILAEIVGSRYKPEENQLRLSSEQFGSRIENKRHLVSMLDRLVFAARKLASEVQKQNQNQGEPEGQVEEDDDDNDDKDTKTATAKE